MTIRTVFPFSDNGADRWPLLRGRNEVSALALDIANFRKDLANVEPGVGGAIGPVDFDKGTLCPPGGVFAPLGAAGNAVTALFTHRVDKVVKALAVEVVAEILNLLETLFVAIAVEAGVSAELLTAVGSGEIVDAGAAGKVASSEGGA